MNVKLVRGKGPNKTRGARFAAYIKRGLLRLFIAVWARVVVFPARAAVVLTGTAWYFSGRLVASILTALVVVAGAQGARGLIKRRSRLINSILTTLVKSLRLRNRTRRRWDKAMRQAGLEKPQRGSEPIRPTRRRVKLTPLGVRTRVNMGAIGATADELRAKRRSIEASVRAIDSRVRETGPGWADLELRHSDPLSRKINMSDLPPATRRGHIVVGIDEDGLGVEKDLRLPNLLVGAQGSGKSSELWTTLRAIQRAGIPTRVRVFDPKGGQEFTDLAGVAWSYERDPFAWGKFLGEAVGALLKRQAELSEQGIRNLNWYTPENPLDLMVIDELVTVLSTMKSADVKVNTPGGSTRKMSASDALVLYLSQARAAGFSMIALSQIGTKDIIGPVRPLFGYATCLRVGALESDMVDVLLGNGASKMYPAHRLPAAEASAGVGFVDTQTDRGIVKYRAAYLSEVERRATVKQVARDTARLREARRVAREAAGE